MFYKNLIFVAALAAAPAFAAELPTTQASAPADLASLLEGEFTTMPAPIAQADPAQTPGDMAMYAMAKRVDMPLLGRYVVYSELRRGKPDGQILRQRIYALNPDEDAGRIRMKTFALSEPKGKEGVYANPAMLANLKMDEMRQFPANCEMLWRKTDDGFMGDIASTGCSAAVAEHLTVTKTGLAETQQAFGNSGSSKDAAAKKPTEFRRLR